MSLSRSTSVWEGPDVKQDANPDLPRPSSIRPDLKPYEVLMAKKFVTIYTIGNFSTRLIFQQQNLHFANLGTVRPGFQKRPGMICPVNFAQNFFLHTLEGLLSPLKKFRSFSQK